MDWSEEKWIKVYTRDTADWLALSWRAQGLLKLIERKADAAGALHLGRQGRKGVAACIGHPGDWPELEPILAELERDGWVSLEGDKLLVREFVEAQAARASQRVKKQMQRERDDADFAAAGLGYLSQNAREKAITVLRGVSPPVTPGVTASHPVSPDVPTRLEETRGEEREATAARERAPAREADPQPASPPEAPAADPQPDPDLAVYLRWRELWAPRASPVLDKKRQKIIEARRKERPRETAQADLLRSLEGWKRDPWADRPQHAKLEQLLRDAGQVDKGLELASRGGPGRPAAANATPGACCPGCGDQPETEAHGGPACYPCLRAWQAAYLEAHPLADQWEHMQPEAAEAWRAWCAQRRAA